MLYRRFCGTAPVVAVAIILCAIVSGSAYVAGVSANQRYFLDQNAQPAFWLGDTQWELFRVLTVDESSGLFEQRSTQGFNAMQIMVAGVPPEFSSIPGPRPWLNDNPLTPNESFFEHMDSVVETARDAEITLVVGVWHRIDCENGRITEQNVRQWAAWLAGRYRDAGNIIWSMYPAAWQSYENMCRLTAHGLFDGDSGAHLITTHPDPSPASSSFMHSEEWLGFNTYQTWASTYVNYTMAVEDYERSPVKPVVDGEARYEGEGGTSAFDCRRGAYWACLGGAYYSYGHGNNWIDPTSWQSWVNSTGAQQMSVLAELFRSISWWKLVPDQSVMTGSAGERVSARSSDGDWLMVYFPTAGGATVDMSTITATQQADAVWVDPRTGDRTDIGQYATTGTQSFTTPGGWPDAVLLVQVPGGTGARRPTAPSSPLFDVSLFSNRNGIAFRHAYPGRVRVTVVNSMGRVVAGAVVEDGRLHRIPASLPAGIYHVRVSAAAREGGRSVAVVR
jgi:hypothetical protein